MSHILFPVQCLISCLIILKQFCAGNNAQLEGISTSSCLIMSQKSIIVAFLQMVKKCNAHLFEISKRSVAVENVFLVPVVCNRKG